MRPLVALSGRDEVPKRKEGVAVRSEEGAAIQVHRLVHHITAMYVPRKVEVRVVGCRLAGLPFEISKIVNAHVRAELAETIHQIQGCGGVVYSIRMEILY